MSAFIIFLENPIYCSKYENSPPTNTTRALFIISQVPWSVGSADCWIVSLCRISIVHSFKSCTNRLDPIMTMMKEIAIATLLHETWLLQNFSISLQSRSTIFMKNPATSSFHLQISTKWNPERCRGSTPIPRCRFYSGNSRKRSSYITLRNTLLRERMWYTGSKTSDSYWEGICKGYFN